MATDVLDDQEMREAQRDYLDFLDDDVSLACCSIARFADKSEKKRPCVGRFGPKKKKKPWRGFILLIVK